MANKKMIGITICGVLGIVIGFLHIGLLASYFYIRYTKQSLMVGVPSFHVSLKQILWLLFSVFYIVAGWFLLSLKQWARLLMLILTGIYLFSLITSTLVPFSFSIAKSLVQHRNSIPDSGIFFVILLTNIMIFFIFLFLLYYLNLPKVKEQFK